jgi:hypothetical protein
MKAVFYNKDDTIENPALFTPWSFMHILSSIQIILFLYYYGFRKNIILYSFLIHSLYELKDYYFSYVLKVDYGVWYNNSFLNTIGDTISCFIGIYIGIYLIKNRYDVKNSFLNIIFIEILFKIISDEKGYG